MSEIDSNPELIPYFVSFEGSMPADKLAEIVALLGEISTEVQVSVRVGNPEAEELLDVPIGVNDVFRVAEANEISKVLAGRTAAILKKLPDLYGERFLLPQGGYSSKELKEAISRGDLEAIVGMGPKSCELVSLVIEDLEAQA
ncbi:MAG: hypothetical protein U0451_01915 [Candidatus Saccharimonadales bacterium]